jgi:16S rRNA (cytosine1402-N4)-methyltransferase
MGEALAHVPVLLSEVLTILKPAQGETVLDATLGLGGHARAFTNAIGQSGVFVGLEADRRNLELATKSLQHATCNMKLIHTNFRALQDLQHAPVDIIFADLGLSSPHVDNPSRGFSFRFEGPLDLRYDQSKGRSAAELLAESDEQTLTNVFSSYGELARSKTLASVIWKRMHKDRFSITTTSDLTKCVEEVHGFRTASVLPQVFQALRIWVNDELGALRAFLEAAPHLLKPGGRLGVISYHSLEDRMTKQTFRDLSQPDLDQTTGQIIREADFALLTKKAVVPTAAEVERNPRSRSAKFRAIARRL